ncbi:MAG: hypothetical protein NTW21_24420 [Verrucomicrobia bacterium]|nr:hypothetical protein [Verrucomicrobiota bacterium]
MKHPMIAGLAVLVTSLTVLGAEPKTGPNIPAAAKTNPTGQWRTEPPADCPFKPSAVLTGLVFTGRHAEYTGADTWYPSWASDGNLYSPWTDGEVNGLAIGSGGDGAATGHATIRGDDPLKLTVTDQGAFKSSPRPYEGRYPCGSLVHNGVWYFGTYFNTYILESDLVTGPWKLVTYLKHFGQQAYFVNIPSKFISKDGRTMWLCYSANFAAGWGKADIQSRPEGSKYAMCLQEIKLLGR